MQVKRIVPTKDCSTPSLPVVVDSRSRLVKSDMTRSPQLLWEVWYSRGLQSCRGYGYGLNMAQPYLRKKLFVYEECNVHYTFVWPSHVAYVVSVFCDDKKVHVYPSVSLVLEYGRYFKLRDLIVGHRVFSVYSIM